MEGRLTIQLEPDGGDGVRDVHVRSSRPVHAAAVFRGKTVSEVHQMIPLLFSICATAQACAGVRAMEQAMGLFASKEIERHRDCLVNMETLREHLGRILLDWPLSTGDPANKACMVEVVAGQREYQGAFGPESDLFALQGGKTGGTLERPVELRDHLLELLHQHVFGMSVDRWAEITTYGQLVEWSTGAHTASAKMVNSVINQAWNNSGACDSRPLPKLDDAKLGQKMKDSGFIEQPQWQGRCCETTSLTRAHSPLLDDLKPRFANGLLVRLVARLQEVATLTKRMVPAKRIVPDPDREHAPSAREAAGSRIGMGIEKGIGIAVGIGQLAAARGQLIHRVELVEDRVSDYRILAPTEWNFHPYGVLVSALATLRGSVEQIEVQARLLINAIDPCVGFDLVIGAED